MKKYIYGFDLSLSRVGISIFTDDGKCVLVTSIETNSRDEHPARLRYIGDEILKLRESYKPSMIIIEQGFSRYAASTQAIFKVFGVCSYLFSDVKQVTMPPTTIKKIVTGSGNSQKEEVRNYISKKYPNIKFKNLDESDSFSVCLAWFYREGILKK